MRCCYLWPFLHDGLSFQSTHSITECDSPVSTGQSSTWYFNPRTPLQSAIRTTGIRRFTVPISIHALHYRVRSLKLMICQLWKAFQSTHSITECDLDVTDQSIVNAYISIHALHYRVRSETCSASTFKRENFNPRTPLQSAMVAVWSGSIAFTLFQSTHSITECDNQYDQTVVIKYTFQSTHSITECDDSQGNLLVDNDISIHALHYRVR